MVMRSISQVPLGGRLFFGRCSVAPFEAATALLAMWTGASSFFDLTVASTVVNLALPPQFVVAFNLMYLLSGAFMLAGLGWNYRNLEATGVIFLLTSLLVRLIVLVVMVGFALPIVGALLQNLTFGVACAARLTFLLKHRTMAIVDSPRVVSGD